MDEAGTFGMATPLRRVRASESQGLKKVWYTPRFRLRRPMGGENPQRVLLSHGKGRAVPLFQQREQALFLRPLRLRADSFRA